ncbi:uncharacterized, partial [Tachysurus ichikawai]
LGSSTQPAKARREHICLLTHRCVFSGFYEAGSAEQTYLKLLLYSGQSYDWLFKPLGRNWAGKKRAEVAEEYCKIIQKKKKTAKSKHCGLGKPFECRCNFPWLAYPLIRPPAFTTIFTATFVFLSHFLVYFDSMFVAYRTLSSSGEEMVLWGKQDGVETFLVLLSEA